MLGDLLRKFVTLIRSPGLPRVRAGGRVWYFTPAGWELFGPAGPPLDRWITDGTAVPVKVNLARSVYRVDLAGGPVYVKVCHVRTPRAWAREVLRPPKARLEFDKARELLARGIAVVEPLAWATTDSLWPGESVLVTRGRAAIPFRRYLESVWSGLPPSSRAALRRRLAVALGEFFARLHDAGITHPDPHPDNLLIETAEGGGPHFVLIDVHDVGLGRPLAWLASRDNLAVFNRWFQLRASRADRARFWRAYCHCRRAPSPPDSATCRDRARELEAATHTANLRLWSGRENRWLGTSRAVRPLQHGPFRGLAVRDLSDDSLAALLADPDAAFTRPGSRLLKDCPSATVAVVPLPTPGGPVPVVLKRVGVRSWFDGVRNRMRPSQVWRAWRNGHALRDRWLPTPRPLAVFHRYRRGLPAEGYLLTELVPDAQPLTAAHARAVVEPLARLLRAMHDRGVSHRDLKAPNILLAHGTEPVLIDLVGVRTGVRPTVRRRAKDLARLNASFVTAPAGLTRTDRLRFLLVYLRAGPDLGADWKTWWTLVSRATVAKVERNRRRGRVLG